MILLPPSLLMQRTAQCDGVCVVGAADRGRTGIKCCLLCVFGCSLALRQWGHSLTSQRVGSDFKVRMSLGVKFTLRCCALKVMCWKDTNDGFKICLDLYSRIIMDRSHNSVLFKSRDSNVIEVY